jgi:hypothetical protein
LKLIVVDDDVAAAAAVADKLACSCNKASKKSSWSCAANAVSSGVGVLELLVEVGFGAEVTASQPNHSTPVATQSIHLGCG